MAELVSNLTDFARTKLGSGLSVQAQFDPDLGGSLRAVVEEVRSANPGRVIDFHNALTRPVWCEAPRLEQLTSKLPGNALQYGQTENRSGEQGLGLGLYIVAAIAQAHGGTVHVESEGGQTTFALRMPVDGRIAAS